MKVLISLSAKEAIAKNSRVAVRQGSDYWLATVTRRSDDTVNVQYDEGTKGTATLRSLTHLPDGTKAIKKPLTKEQVAALKAKTALVKATVKKVEPAAQRSSGKARTTNSVVPAGLDHSKAFKARLKKLLGRIPQKDHANTLVDSYSVSKEEWTQVQKALVEDDGFKKKLEPSKNPAFDKKHGYKKYTLTKGPVKISAVQQTKDARYFFIVESAKSSGASETPPKKEVVKKTVITKADEDAFEAKYKAQRDAEVAHIRILDPGNVVEYKGRQYHIADARPMSKRGAGKTALLLKDDAGKLYKFNVPTYNHPLKLVRKASDTEHASTKKTLDDRKQRVQQRAEEQYDKSRGLGITHDSVGDYALIKFTNGTKWMPIQKVDASGRVGIQGSGSKLRWIEARHIQSVSPTTSSDPKVQKSAKQAKELRKGLEQSARIYSDLARFRKNERGGAGDGTEYGASVSMPYVQGVRDFLKKSGYAEDKPGVFKSKDSDLTVSLHNQGDSFRMSVASPHKL